LAEGWPQAGLEPAKTRVNIGIVLRNQGKYGDALEMYLAALPVLEKALGPDHLDVATTCRNIGIIMHNQEKYHEAYGWYERSRGIYAQAGHPCAPEMDELCQQLRDFLATVDPGRDQGGPGRGRHSVQHCLGASDPRAA